MQLKPLASLGRDEVRDLIRVHAMMFAFLRFKRNHPDRDEEDAHAFAARYWEPFRDMALDYLALNLALAEKEAAHSN